MSMVIKKLPIPICGLSLGLAALGNLVGGYSSIFRGILGSISAIIMLLLLLKILLDTKSVREGLNNPVIASVMSTIPMAVMLLTTYIKPYFSQVAFILWIVGLILNGILILFFTKKYMFKFNIKKVFPSYFVLYVGIVVGSVTAPGYNLSKIGQILFWYGLFVYLPLIPVVTYRVFKLKEIPEAVKPITIIYAAPASLLLAGYMSSFNEKSLILVIFLGILALFMTISCFVIMPKMLKIKFYPSYSAFTFPFVISAIAMNMTNNYLTSINKGILILRYIVNIEIIWAIVIVLYVLIRYVDYMIRELKISKEPKLNI